MLALDQPRQPSLTSASMADAEPPCPTIGFEVDSNYGPLA